MRPDGSLDAPFTLEDDDPPNIPGPTVRRRHRQTLDQDGIEEISDSNQAAAAWKQVAARRQAKQRSGTNLSNATSEGDSSTKDSKLTNKARDRTSSSAKAAGIVDLSFDNDEPPMPGQTTPSIKSTRDKGASSQASQFPVPRSNTLHEAVLPERAKPAESPKRTSQIFSLPMESLAGPTYHSHRLPWPSGAQAGDSFTGLPDVPSTTSTHYSPFLPSPSVIQAAKSNAELSMKSSATSAYHSHYLPQSSLAPVAGPSAKASRVTPLNRSPSSIPISRAEPSVTTQAIPGQHNGVTEPTYRGSPALGTSSDSFAHALSHVVPPSMQPIRDVAETAHEPTPPSCLDTASELDDARPDRDSSNVNMAVPRKTPESNFPSIPRLPQKQKAIKSVRRRNGISVSRLPVRPSHQFSADQQDAPNAFPMRPDVALNNSTSASPLITRRSHSRTSTIVSSIVADREPVRTEEEFGRTVRPGGRITMPTEGTPMPHEDIGEVAPERAVRSAPLLSRSATPTARDSYQTLAEPTLAFQLPLSDTEIATVDISTAAFGRTSNNAPQPEHPGDFVENDSNQASRKLLLQPDMLTTTCSAVEGCLKRHVADRHEFHVHLVEAKMRHQRTFQEQELRARCHKQKRPQQPTLPKKYIQKTSPFENMPAIQMPFDRAHVKRLVDMSQELFVKAKPKDTVIKSGLSASTTKYKSNAPKIPPFKEYVSLRNNVLADNESKLLATPYFQDEDYRGRDVLLDTLPYIYEMTHDEKGPLDFRKEQCRFYKNPVEAFLSEIGITWDDILYYLLAQEEDITRINNSLDGKEQFEALLLERSRYHVEEFERDGEQKKTTLFDRNDSKWREFVGQLKEPIASALRLAATACAAALKECEFSIWYLAQQSEAVQSHIAKKIAHEQSAKHSMYKQIMCRVCHQHNCLLHGEIREVPEDSWKTDSEDEEGGTQATDDTSRRGSDNRTPRRISNISRDDTDDEHEPEGPLPAHFDDDSDIEKVTNYKLPANPDAFDACPESEMITSKGAIPPPGKFNSNWWLNQDTTQRWEKRKPFFPCKHEGSCTSANCRCFREGINCEKTCKCSHSCNRRYPGCSCATASGKRVCLAISCLCVKFNRECDADLCGSCGASKVLDPVNRYNDDVVQRNCCNVAIQRGVPRKTLLGHSEVHGFGLYMGEDIKNGEYIGEYTGEAISVKEGDRRVTIYNYQKTMYLFRLNSKQEVDATYMGNKLRFINNADDKYTNCGPKNLLCNTVFRIALFATRDIKAGTELYFNYNYPKEKTEEFKQPNAKIVAVKQTKQKAKKRESLTSLSQPIEDRSRILAATAKAREAKAAKRRAAMLQEGGVEPDTRKLSGTLQARKAATSKPGRKTVRKSKRGGLHRNESTGSDTGVDVEASDPEIPRVIETQSTQASLYVQDTDEEDGEFILPDTQEDEEGQEVGEPAPSNEGTVGRSTRSRRGPGRPRKRAPDVAPVVAVKQTKSTKGGARPGAGRKRKRPVILNSDDE